jgi:hypothetical protein
VVVEGEVDGLLHALASDLVLRFVPGLFDVTSPATAT